MEIVKMLVEADANVQAKSARGQKPTMIVSENSNENAYLYLRDLERAELSQG